MSFGSDECMTYFFLDEEFVQVSHLEVICNHCETVNAFFVPENLKWLIVATEEIGCGTHSERKPSREEVDIFNQHWGKNHDPIIMLSEEGEWLMEAWQFILYHWQT